jgi:hypothetical protein
MSRRATTSRWLALATALVVGACSVQPTQPPGPPAAGSPDEADPIVMTAPMSAAQTRAEFERVKGQTPLPAGVGWKPVIIDEGWYGEWGGGSMVEFQALCAWLREAVDATTDKDADRFAAADTVLAAIPTWRTFSDPARMDPTSRAFVRQLVDSAARGEFDAVGPYLAANCS